ncbi:MAG TPA: DNA polymerase III subunit gamma/tau, partial [Caldithrix sp.]|nr:DNA polymerase III subunit gamma/tau [Caldithrix sp.]
MSYVVIARRWRPQQFDEIIAQEHVSKTLSNAIANNRIAHAYIFTGPRGIGKTTTARILAKALNCEKGPTATPCNECSACLAITQGNSLDVLEIDGASNRGIDEIRNLRENIRFTPTMGKYRIYIIDEVHMLTKEAFNALLKTLEEPPSHALFIFATTEIHKVPATILSRCQRFDFKRIPIKTIMEHLKYICDTDKIKIDDDALLQIAKKADGSMRDSQSILDQIISFSGDTIKFENVAQALGVIHQDQYFKISDLILEKNLKEIILQTQEIFNSGFDLTEFLLGLEEHFRNILITVSTGSTELIETSENYLKRYEETAPKYHENDLIAVLKIIADTIVAVKISQQPQLKFELGLIKIAKLPSSKDIESLLDQLDLLKKKAKNNRVTETSSIAYSPADSELKTSVAIITIQTIKDQWPVVLDKIHENKPSLAASLEHAIPVKLD